ncbi:hypothetical protein AYO40_00265 [Planctomycetaceae bacterium SCGC AG-212-D15]|nr:hypothetical protein AYO40_00265 [Planctomycetaceae bacterium SCGC AG-212-D15]
MRLCIYGCLCVLLLSGCEAAQLRNKTVRQAATLSDLQYKQVLDNLAMFQADPGAMPFYLLTPAGVTTIQQTVTPSGSINWDYTFIGTLGRFAQHADKKSLALMLNQQDIGTWNTIPTYFPENLKVMQCAYRKAIGHVNPDDEVFLQAFFFPSKTVVTHGPTGTHIETTTPTSYSVVNIPLAPEQLPAPKTSEPPKPPTDDAKDGKRSDAPNDPKKDDKKPQPAPFPETPAKPNQTTTGQGDVIAQALKAQEYSALEPGWFHAGRLCDVPFKACYVGRYKRTYVWVMPGEVEHLTNFALAILDIATSAPEVSINKPAAKGAGEAPTISRQRMIYQPAWNQYIAPQP